MAIIFHRTFFIFLFCFPLSLLAQEKVAFINKNRVLDSMSQSVISSYQKDYADELVMMETIMKKKRAEVMKCIELVGMNCKVEDTIEYYQRIQDRKQQIENDLFNMKMQLNEENTTILKKEADKFCKKKGYKEWKDTSKGMPIDYNNEHDFTDYMILILKPD